MGLGAGAAAIAAAAIGAGGAIGGGMLGASGAEHAAQTAANTEMSIFDTTQKNLAPFISMGGSAFQNLSGLLGFGPGGFNQASANNAMNTLQRMPGYQFQLNQGMKATDAAAAARGLNLSGGQIKGEQQFAQGTAQNAWNSYIGQLTGAATLGENAAAGQGTIGAQTGASIGNTLFQGGMAGTNYMVGGLQGGLQNASLSYLLSQQGQNGAYYSPGGAGYDSIYSGQGPEGVSMSDLSGYDSQYSDVRMKKDIRRVGTTDEGLGVYLYRFKAGGPTQMGVLAQEVERSRPDAVATLPSGLKVVRYGKLSTPMERYLPAHLKEAA